MEDDPVRILLATAGDGNASRELDSAALFAPARRLVEVCEIGDKLSRSLTAGLPSSPDSGHKPTPDIMKGDPKWNDIKAASGTPRTDDATLMGKLAALSHFEKVHLKLLSLSKSARAADMRIKGAVKAVAEAMGVKMMPCGDITFREVSTLSKSLKGKLNELEGSLDTANSALGEMRENAMEANMRDVAALERRRDAIRAKSADAVEALIKFDKAVANLPELRAEILSARKSLLGLPGAGSHGAAEWCRDWDEPDAEAFYEPVNVRKATDILTTLLKEFVRGVGEYGGEVSALQPPFETMASSSINVSEAFPSMLAVGVETLMPLKGNALLKSIGGIPGVPHTVPFPFKSPLLYGDADILQMVILRMAQALPQGLFDVLAVDSNNSGQTFREIAGLRKIGILTVSSKRQNDERILSDLDNWLGDLSDRGCWDDAGDWSEYNGKHGDKPLPFKLVVIPSFSALDYTQMSIVSKLAKNGPSAGVVPVFAKNAIDALKGEDGHPNAKGFAADAEKFMDLDAIVSSSDGEIGGQFVRHSSLLKLPPPAVRERVFKAIGDARVEATSRRKSGSALGIDVLFAKIKLWSGDATDGFSFPIGVLEDGGLLWMEIGDTNVHGLVGGMTGSGKSNLLHAIIHSLCWKYSPTELELHLLDYKDGMEFKVYSSQDESQVWLPHAKTISTHNDPAYALSLFDELQNEAMRRKRLFGQARSYREFRQKGGRLPRILVLVDEFHKLFEGPEGNVVAERIIQILKQGRSYGIHLLMSTQSLRGVNADLFAMKGQIGVRLALRGNDDDGILDPDNAVAANIERPFCIYNDRMGQMSGNHLFRVPFVDVASDTEAEFQKDIEKAADDGAFQRTGRVFRGTELPRRPPNGELLVNAPATSGIAVRIGVCNDYLAMPAFASLDDAPNGHLLAAAPAGDEMLDDTGYLTCDDVWNGLRSSIFASLEASPDTTVLIYDPIGRDAPFKPKENWSFLGAQSGEEELRNALKELSLSSAGNRVLVVENWAKAIKLHPREETLGGTYLDDTPSETARSVFASAFSSANDRLPFHVVLLVRNFTFASRNTFGGYGSKYDILRGCSQRIGVNLSESDLQLLFSTLPTSGLAHKIFFGSSDSDEVVRFLPFRPSGV